MAIPTTSKPASKGALTMNDDLINILDNLVINNDILPVRVSLAHMAIGAKNKTTRCPGALAIADSLGRPGCFGITIHVGHKTKPHLGNRVVIKVAKAPESKWIGWIMVPHGKGGFHPKKFDQGKQKLPGAMIVEKWSKEVILQMPADRKSMLHSAEYRQINHDYLSEIPKNGSYRIFNE
jgi:hypothetical protein